MSLSYQIEPLSLCWNEMIQLAAAHWQETEGYRHGQPFCPSFERYNQYDQAGWFIMFIARDGAKMAGYAGMYLTPSMHTQQLIATEDTWFLLPQYRKGRNAIQFYQFVEDECRRRGVVEIGMTAKLTNSAGRILEYLGYEVVSKQYSKHLSYNPKASPQPETASSEVCADSAIANPVMESANVRTLSTAPT